MEQAVAAHLWYTDDEWTVRFRPDAPLKAYEVFLRESIADVAKRHFKIGDAYNQLVKRFPDDLYQLFDRVDYEEGTIRNDGYVAGRFPVAQRGKPGLSWSHYQELAAIKDPAERDRLMEQCTIKDDGSERMTIDELRDYKRREEGGQSGGHVEGNCPACLGEGDVSPLLREQIQKALDDAGVDINPF